MPARYYRAMHARRSRFPARIAPLAAIATLALLAGCATVRHAPHAPEGGPPTGEAPAGPRYDPVPGQDAATIVQLRAAPPPREAELADGSTPAGDEPLLTARGYVRVGTGYFPGDRPDAQSWARHQAERVGADKALVYADTAPSALRIDFYVRYRLPFGATFRSVTRDEQAALESGGVRLGEVVGGTPASEANLRRGDFIVKFDGKPIADRPAFEQLLREHLGRRVTLTVRRDGVTIERLVRLGVVAKNVGDGRK
jgi:membrane-associated protease RseP (regulator of RpoE activity)